MAATQEGLAGVLYSIAQSGLGQFVYRMAAPDQVMTRAMHRWAKPPPNRGPKP
jgi:hypothetical protein